MRAWSWAARVDDQPRFPTCALNDSTSEVREADAKRSANSVKRELFSIRHFFEVKLNLPHRTYHRGCLNSVGESTRRRLLLMFRCKDRAKNANAQTKYQKINGTRPQQPLYTCTFHYRDFIFRQAVKVIDEGAISVQLYCPYDSRFLQVYLEREKKEPSGEVTGIPLAFADSHNLQRAVPGERNPTVRALELSQMY